MARRGDRVYATRRDVDGKNAGVANGMRALASADGIDLRVLELDVNVVGIHRVNRAFLPEHWADEMRTKGKP